MEDSAPFALIILIYQKQREPRSLPLAVLIRAPVAQFVSLTLRKSLVDFRLPAETNLNLKPLRAGEWLAIRFTRNTENFMAIPDSHEVTELLLAWSEGDQDALDRLMPLVYEELRRLAQSYMRRERAGHTLQTTA